MKVTMFCQVSIDGKLTLGKGHSSKGLFSLLNQDDIHFIHNFRGKVDGIMVGRNTVNIDNPALTDRFEVNHNPIRIIPTTSLSISESSTVLNDEVRTIFVTLDRNREKKDMLEMYRRKSKKVIFCGDDAIDFKKLFGILESEYNIKKIMLEGGGSLNWSMIQAGLVDEIIIMQLPIIIGGYDTVTLVDGQGYTDLNFVKYFKLYSTENKGNYLLLKYKKANRSQPE